MLPLSRPKGAQKRKVAVFGAKIDCFRRKAATKFLCLKTFSSKVVRHSLAYLTVHKWLVEDVPEIWGQNDLPL